MASIRIDDLNNINEENFLFNEFSSEEVTAINGGGIFGAIFGAVVGAFVGSSNGGGFIGGLQGAFQGAVAGAVLPF